jgi:site-specific DNA recombinase
LRRKRAELEARLKDGEDNPVLSHPNMAGYYRDQVTHLREALSGNTHAEAVELIRKLTDRIVLTPVEDEHGHKTLPIDLHGHLAAILSLATKAKKKPLGESGFPVESIKLVAGTRNQCRRPAPSTANKPPSWPGIASTAARSSSKNCSVTERAPW